jgi:radical SAM protein with 4Fe4S-binding SPASM domain
VAARRSAAETIDHAVLNRLTAAFDLPHLDAATPDIRRKKSLRLTGRISLHFDSRFTWPSPQLPVRTQSGFCHGLSSHFGVLADGTVVPCCLDKEAALPLGNCNDTPLATILSGPRASAMREGFARGELVEDFCRRCPFVARFDRKARRIVQKGKRPGSC